MKETNRIDHLVWVVHPENLDRYVAQLADLFDTKFEEMSGESAHFFISWDAGLEIAAPSGDGPAGGVLRAHLEKNGEGPFAVVVQVPDIEDASARASKLGWPVDQRLLGGQADMTWTSKVTTIRERFIGPFLNTMLLFGQIDYVDNAERTPSETADQ